jgi:hypothetical protein
VGARGLLRLVDQLGDVAGLEVEERTVDSDTDHLAGRRRESAHRVREHVRHRDVALAASDLGRVAARDLHVSRQLVDCALLDAFLAEHRQHVRDVVHEYRVRPDDEHAGAFQLAPVGVEKPRRAVQADLPSCPFLGRPGR